jgi:hypothetical protein
MERISPADVVQQTARSTAAFNGIESVTNAEDTTDKIVHYLTRANFRY